MSTSNRILDANVNRAAEGMRVLEDIARFALDRVDLCGAIKQCRHTLRHALAGVDSIYSRDTKCDVGTVVSTSSESTRSQLHDVAIAAGNRCSEGLRVIEEILKLDSEDLGIESLRYQMYDHLADVVRSLGARTRRQWKLCFILTKDTCALPWEEVLPLVLGAGCDCVQIREKNMPTKQLIAHTKKVIQLVGDEHISVIVNDRTDVALAANANGVHLGSQDMSIQQARKLCGSCVLIGATVHSVEEAKVAVDQGADYLGVGPVFTSTTKPDLVASGTLLLQDILSAFPLTHHLAIGGIHAENVQQIYTVGCQGVAVCSAIANSTTPDKIVRNTLKGALQPS